jgi:hypothetical protein
MALDVSVRKFTGSSKYVRRSVEPWSRAGLAGRANVLSSPLRHELSAFKLYRIFLIFS